MVVDPIRNGFCFHGQSISSNDAFQAAEELLPAVVCALIRCLLIGTEAGLLHAKMGAALGWSQREEHHPLKPAFASANAPVIGQALQRVDDQHLAVDNAIPVRHGVGPELELAPDHRLEVVVHHPLREERALGERAPQLLWRVREYPFDRQGCAYSLRLVIACWVWILVMDPSFPKGLQDGQSGRARMRRRD